MQHSYYYFSEVFTKATITANENEVVFQTKSPFSEYATTFGYDSLSERITYGKRNLLKLSSLGSVIVFLAITIDAIFKFFPISNSPAYKMIRATILLTGVITILVSALFKRKYVYIHEKTEYSNGVWIVYSQKTAEEADKLVHYIKEKIKLHQEVQS